MNILIIEDEKRIADLLEDYLKAEGYTTQQINTGANAVNTIRETHPDLVLLDIMLPEVDGISICQQVRKTSQVPIIMISAKVEEMDRILGLDLGADDYICKPFSPKEVMARVRAVLRRHYEMKQPSEWTLDETRSQIHFQEQSVALTAVEFALFQVLFEHPGQIFSRAQLMNRIYQDGRIVSDRTVDSHIKKLRQKMHQVWPDTDVIHSVYGIGYKFEVLEEGDPGLNDQQADMASVAAD
ncbi:response regulator [Thiomicrospira sp. ALE5]|uniref:response regulator n=1 Tax=Thiomicrospira sp. ALE5 TaxID=748650 RepID=UPI0008E71B2C|nr:response regulator [Thiomicrospira sp. ALE5]SFR54624.1 two-component system, OmpR family, response regulator BaeR [Thiomicrospira sp. ALE5]